MQRDWLLGFPPVLLAQDFPARKQFVTPPREVRAELRTFWEAGDLGAYQGIAEADCRQKSNVVAPDSSAAEAPALGVWRRTAEHRPPPGDRVFMTRQIGGARPPRPLAFDGQFWRNAEGEVAGFPTVEWLDTSGEFKVGDRVLTRVGYAGLGRSIVLVVTKAPNSGGVLSADREDGRLKNGAYYVTDIAGFA